MILNPYPKGHFSAHKKDGKSRSSILRSCDDSEFSKLLLGISDLFAYVRDTAMSETLFVTLRNSEEWGSLVQSVSRQIFYSHSFAEWPIMGIVQSGNPGRH